MYLVTLSAVLAAKFYTRRELNTIYSANKTQIK
jgi:hypothetical protein